MCGFEIFLYPVGLNVHKRNLQSSSYFLTFGKPKYSEVFEVIAATFIVTSTIYPVASSPFNFNLIGKWSCQRHSNRWKLLWANLWQHGCNIRVLLWFVQFLFNINAVLRYINYLYNILSSFFPIWSQFNWEMELLESLQSLGAFMIFGSLSAWSRFSCDSLNFDLKFWNTWFWNTLLSWCGHISEIRSLICNFFAFENQENVFDTIMTEFIVTLMFGLKSN